MPPLCEYVYSQRETLICTISKHAYYPCSLSGGDFNLHALKLSCILQKVKLKTQRHPVCILCKSATTSPWWSLTRKECWSVVLLKPQKKESSKSFERTSSCLTLRKESLKAISKGRRIMRYV